ncbi:MAG: PQQ-binding-like beta-propeller repeat protein [Actinobacteria bacterium]|nr:PQQ-binding-like beta-propeller repeat protein [Actinomycetota bacterium]
MTLTLGASLPAAWADDPAPPPAVTDPAPVVTDPPAPPVTDPAAPPPVTDPPPATDPPPVTDPPPPPPPATVTPTALSSWGTAKASGTTKSQMVRAIVEAGGIAYVGGEFTKMVSPASVSTTVSRGYLAAINSTTGDLTGWNPNANKKVWSMALSADGKSVYVGGDFSSIGGVSASHLARISLATGKIDPAFKPKSITGRVRALTLDGDRLYVGGEFTSVGGQLRPKLAAVNPTTGDLLSWMPPALNKGRFIGHTGIPTPDYAPGHVFAIAVIGGKVFAAGNFLNFGGQGGLVTIDAATGALTDPQYTPKRPMFGLEAAGGVLYAVGGGPGGLVEALSPSNSKPLWKQRVDGDAVDVAVSATSVYVAGHYDNVILPKDKSCYQNCPGGPRRHHLAAFNAADGAPLPWNPDADTSTGPFTVTAGANALYVGGEFNNINSKRQGGFVIFPGRP